MLKVPHKLCGKMKVLRLPCSGLESSFSDFSVLPFHLHTDKRQTSNTKVALPWIRTQLGFAAMPPVFSQESPVPRQEGTSPQYIALPACLCF